MTNVVKTASTLFMDIFLSLDCEIPKISEELKTQVFFAFDDKIKEVNLVAEFGNTIFSGKPSFGKWKKTESRWKCRAKLIGTRWLGHCGEERERSTKQIKNVD